MSGSNSLHPGDGGSARAAESAEPLSFAVHSMPAPALADDRVRHGRLKMLLVLLVCAAPVLASYFIYYVVRPEGRTNHGSFIEPQRALPPAQALPLADLDGRAVAPASLVGQWLLVAVAGGACDALCERQLYLQRQLRESLGKNKERLDRVWLIADSAPVRPELLRALQGATVLRTTPEALAAWLEPQPGQPLGASLHLVDPLGNYMMRFPAPSEPKPIQRDLERLMRGSAGWDQPGR